MSREFLALHTPGAPFVMANVVDIAGALTFRALGFRALATSSAGFAFRQGRRDGQMGRARSLAHAAELAQASGLPVSGDFENGFGDSPAAVVETVEAAIEAGLAGCSIEDTQGDRSSYARDQAVARIEAATEAIRRRKAGIVLTARADGMLHGNYDLTEAIARLKAFHAAGAPVLYAPGTYDLAGLRRLCDSVPGAVNHGINMGAPGADLAALAQAGVARISLGSSLARAQFSAAWLAGRQIAEEGRFAPLEAQTGWRPEFLHP